MSLKNLFALASVLLSVGFSTLLAAGAPAPMQAQEPIQSHEPMQADAGQAPAAPVKKPEFNIPPGSERVDKNRVVKPLPGGLNDVPVFYSNSPEVVIADGILLSTFPPAGMADAGAHLNFAFKQKFEIFAHHIADGVKSANTEDLYLGLLLGNPGKTPVTLKISKAASYLSQPDAPFISLPQLENNDEGKLFAGPGDRCCNDMLRNRRAADWPGEVKIAPGTTVLLKNLPIPVKMLTPPLNGRSIMASCQASGPLYIALVSKFAQKGLAPKEEDFKKLLTQGALVKPREAPATKPDDTGPIKYGRVSGVAKGSTWVAHKLEDPGREYVPGDHPVNSVSYVLSSLKNGTFGTDQIQSAPMIVRYPDTAYAGHGNYGVKYDLNFTFAGTGSKRSTVTMALENPLKSDRKKPIVFLKPAAAQVFFRGTVKVTLDDRFAGDWSQEEKWKEKDKFTSVSFVHYVLHRGEIGEPFVTFDMKPEDLHKGVKLEIYYPPDATPPQLLTIKSVAHD
jgi:hypothetical protein